jgi:hypothetical protein
MYKRVASRKVHRRPILSFRGKHYVSDKVVLADIFFDRGVRVSDGLTPRQPKTAPAVAIETIHPFVLAY